VDRSLQPGAKADSRKVALYGSGAPWPRLHEVALPLVVSLVLLLRSGSLWYQVVPLAYLTYLFADATVIPQRRRVKWLRNISPLLFTLAFGPAVIDALKLPPVPAGTALAAALLGALLPYFYERALVSLRFVRGLALAAIFELAALLWAPSGLGPHVALPLYAAAFAGMQRTVFWRYSLPFLGGYTLFATWWMGGRPLLLIHGAAGALGLLLTHLVPYTLSREPRGALRPPEGLSAGRPTATGS
jgi:hypothetical protein